MVSSKGTFINDVTQRRWKEVSFRDNNIRLWALERDGGGTGEGHKMYVTSVMNDPYQYQDGPDNFAFIGLYKRKT